MTSICHESSTGCESGSIQNQAKKVYNNVSCWNKEQNFKYAQYLSKNHALFRDETKRRANKVYKQMSELLQTKSIKQCKSHHQKMMRSFKNIPNIIEKFMKQPKKHQGPSIRPETQQKIKEQHYGVDLIEFLQLGLQDLQRVIFFTQIAEEMLDI